MKHRSSIPALLWYAPAAAGLSYLTIFLIAIVSSSDPRYTRVGDTIFCFAQTCIVLSMLLMHNLNLNGRGSWKKFSLWIPAVGALSYMAGVVSTFTASPIILLFPLGALLSGLGMLIVGIQVARAGTLREWKRFTPFFVGLYPFLIMFPIVIITGNPSVHAILLWGVPWTIMGFSLVAQSYTLKKSI